MAFRRSLCRYRWRRRLPPEYLSKPGDQRSESIRRRKAAILRNGMVYVPMLALFALLVLFRRERG